MRPTRIITDPAALRHNLGLIRQRTDARILACVKADAYGHGLLTVGRALDGAVDAFGVVALEYACRLRDAGVRAPVLLMQGAYAPAELEQIAGHDFWLVVHSRRQLRELLAASLPRPLSVWLKMNSGMNRLGMPPDIYQEAAASLLQSPNCQSLTLMTHLACAERRDAPSNASQMQCFNAICDTPQLRALPRSIANSAALLNYPQSHAQWVRCGYLLYGLNPLPDAPGATDNPWQAALSLTSAVIAIQDVPSGGGVGYGHSWRAERDSRIALIAAGYGDGYPQQAAPGTPVLVGGHRAPLVGTVAMDVLAADITDLPAIAEGTPVELWGPNLPVAEVAQAAATSGYELITRLTSRPPRCTP